VVLERGRIGERWRSERWDSLHLLTPNWLNRLRGAPAHADRDGTGSRPCRGSSSSGLRFQSRRTSHTIGGVGRDAAEIAHRILCAGDDCRERVARVRPKLAARLAT
jgi:hypothetical protein